MAVCETVGRKIFQGLFARPPFRLQEQWAQILGKRSIVLKLLQEARPGCESGFQQLKTKYWPFLHGNLVLGEKREIEFDREDTDRMVFLCPLHPRVPGGPVPFWVACDQKSCEEFALRAPVQG